MVTVRPLDAPLGAEILDLDLAAADAPLDDVLAAFHEHQVIAVRGQSLAPADLVRFARRLGRPQPHIAAHLRHPDHSEILKLSNVFEDGAPTGIYDGAAYWHTDVSYEAVPGAATIVHALKTPAAGGETCFANMRAAYEALPAATRRRIDGLTVLHHYGNRADLDEDSRTSAQPLTEAERKNVENVYHPLVMAHPVTGRKALYAVSGSSFGIVGMADDEAVALLDELKAHAIQERFVYRHRYAVGDVVVWDNFSTLHSATLIPPATGPADTRLLHRITVK